MKREADPTDTVCVILAGGRGKRMSSRDTHKTCFPVAGIPAIVRAVDTHKQAGIRRFVVVVGQMADQVMSTVSSKHPDVTFVYQPDPRGTGHAAAVAAEALATQAYEGDIIVVMGDQVTKPEVVRGLLDRFAQSKADLVVTTLPKRTQSSAGRVVLNDDGTPAGIVEVPDIQRAQQDGTSLQVGPVELSADELEARSTRVNISMYAFRFPRLLEAVRQLEPDNAQSELYLTDTVEYIAGRGEVELMSLSDPTDLMAFNSPAELLAIEEVVKARERQPRVLVSPDTTLGTRTQKTIGEWLHILKTRPGELRDELQQIYGADAGLTEERRRAMLTLMTDAARTLGTERPAIVCRAPGRVNLMGRHVDHRGGYVNVMAISREVLLTAAVREDDRVTVRNLQDDIYPSREFSISELLSAASWTDWIDFVDSGTVRSVLDNAPGDWSHYARAPLLRLQHEASDYRLKGMDCVVSGNIPTGAGLSSSSALVVAFAEAAVALNGLNIAIRDFVDLCGEGEWFVGSRGGSADHAAIRTSKVGTVSRIGFFPFRVEGEVEFPSELDVIIAHSGATAVKNAEARDVFNQRVACYEIGEMLFRQTWAATAGIEHLRDIVPERLQVAPSEVYQAIARLPDRPSRRRIGSLLALEHSDDLGRIFGSHANLGTYDLRGVALYGISECARSERFASLMRARDLEEIGLLMKTSHDGDRLWRFGANGGARRHLVRTDEASLRRLARRNAEIESQPGRYACSTRAIDRLVDLALGSEGVVGAQLAGAGLGGCMMVLVRRESRDALVDLLSRHPGVPEDGVYVCRPVAGAGLLSV